MSFESDSKKYWKVLSHLPDDRILPRGVAKDMPKAVAQELQKQLKEWGYYNGSIDGALGAGSAAALKAMLKDREFELKEMSAASDEWSVSNFANGNRMIARSDRVEKLTEWYVYEWAERDKLIGFVKIDKEFRDGIVLYTESNGREHLMLFGAHGFNDAKVLARW